MFTNHAFNTKLFTNQAFNKKLEFTYHASSTMLGSKYYRHLVCTNVYFQIEKIFLNVTTLSTMHNGD